MVVEESCSADGSVGSPWVWNILVNILALPSIIWLVAYLIPQIYVRIRPVPNLKERYNAEWSLVTGSGSGIGKAIAFKLAKQGLNVVLVSLDDDFLKATVKQLQETFPKQQFKAVGVTFSPGVDYLKKIQQATKGLDIPIIFNNAGFMVTGFFEQAPLPKLLANVECNATANVQITHHFAQLLVKNGRRKGCIVFTSSVAGFIPTPFAVMYASTKAFVSQFAASLHIEWSPLGIDVCAIHPSPVASNFYANLEHKVDLLESATKQAVPPEALPDDIFRSIGVCAWRDLGGLAVGTRMGTWFLPYNLFAQLFATAAPFLPDWKTHNQTRRSDKSQ